MKFKHGYIRITLLVLGLILLWFIGSFFLQPRGSLQLLAGLIIFFFPGFTWSLFIVPATRYTIIQRICFGFFFSFIVPPLATYGLSALGLPLTLSLMYLTAIVLGILGIIITVITTKHHGLRQRTLGDLHE